MPDLFAFKTELGAELENVETDNCLHDTENHRQYLNTDNFNAENVEGHSFCCGYEPGCGGRAEERGEI